MALNKKFGTFSGVFTPSILTILGVIMYMRLPWIVGQAGFFLTAGIIIVAHFVSVSTGLSVASIATDKKVKAGGTYYIISRSLGLPIGGTLGIALFFGLSMSVSLYLIGFSESFLGFWGFEITKESIRLCGTLALLLVGTLTFIGTSLAIKTQYFIMTAIGLSLISILFGSTDFAPSQPLINPIEGMSPLILLFAIFFPAVTGFEAGVSMSGDLQDPKKSIPVGTISAITVGLFIYLGMAAFFSYRVDADQLINNPNILLQISFYPPLLVAGIWGATLSSAIGSILGAPRILQATSTDNITPKVFAKGYGKTNEPRNALMLTFVIAEAGILIGELNLIARVVSMFFITTYGFLNLSSSLEKWASTDFRPSFKIPAVVSISGAIVCFTLMLELDFLALIGATLVMGTLFFYLKNKELTLESGDTWEGVWASVLRSGLNRLNRTVKQARNWRPNIILFSGGSTARPHLLQFGRWLVYKRGVLSNFNLIENKDTPVVLKKSVAEDEDLKEKFQGIFTRTMEVNEIYAGMETITKVYGFAGIEPNSVMLGWARRSKKPEQFARLLRSLKQQDFNIFVIDYDQERGYGQNQVIDLWLRGGSNNILFGLTLAKFLRSSEEWEGAEARILLVNDNSSLNNRIYRNINRILDDHRVKATIKIINNALERKPIDDIIRIESAEADLVVMGLPEIREDSARQYIESTDKLIDSLGTVLLISASDFFKPVMIGVEKQSAVTPDSLVREPDPDQKRYIDSLVLPADEDAAAAVLELKEKIDLLFVGYERSVLEQFQEINTTLIEKFRLLIDKSYDEFGEALSQKELHKCKKILARNQSNFLFNTGRLLEEFQTVSLSEQKDTLLSGLQGFLDGIRSMAHDMPAELIIYRDNTLTQKKSFIRNLWNRFKHNQKSTRNKYKVHLPQLIGTAQKEIEQIVLRKHLQYLMLDNFRISADLQKLFTSVVDSLLLLEKSLAGGKTDEKELNKERRILIEQLNSIQTSVQNASLRLCGELDKKLFSVLQGVSDIFQAEKINREINKKLTELKKVNKNEVSLLEIPGILGDKQRLVSNFFVEEIHLKKFQNRVETILERFLGDIELSVNTNFLDKLDELSSALKSWTDDKKELITMPAINPDLEAYRLLFQILLHDVQLAMEDLPEDLETLAEESYQKLEEDPFAESATLKINLKRFTEFLIETELFDPLQVDITALIQSLPKSIDVAQEVVRFTNHNLNSADEINNAGLESISAVIQSGLDRILAEREKINEQQVNFQKKSKFVLGSTFEKMNPYMISRSVGELNQTIRTKESKKIISGISVLNIKIKSWGKNLIVRLVYQKSESVLLAKKLGKASAGYQTKTGRIVDILSPLSPDSEVHRRLPLYYSQLFVDKRMVAKEFLLDRKKELSWATKTLDTYKQGYLGALLVLGDRFAGKSTLSQTIAAKYFDRQKIFHVFPPEGGSIDPSVFRACLSESMKRQGTISSLMNSIPQESVMILHDLELWWERSRDGFQLIKTILDLIYTYSQNCFFIVNTNTASYKFINHIHSIENAFINAIECQPFDSEEIKESILLRHRSTGLKFELLGQNEDQISNLQLARLFNKYFDLSAGNIGQAMYYWLSNIIKVEAKLLKIQSPESTDNTGLEKLAMEWMIHLQQFVLHRQLTSDRLERILGDDQGKMRQDIGYLKRCGLLLELPKDILQINPYARPLVHKSLTEMSML